LTETASSKPLFYQNFRRLLFLWNPKVVKSKKIDSKKTLKNGVFCYLCLLLKKEK